MTAADVSAFMNRHGFTFDRVAAELGIGKRLAGYDAAGRSVPRAIAMACELMDLQMRRELPGPVSSPQVIPPPPPRTAGRSAATRAR